MNKIIFPQAVKIQMRKQLLLLLAVATVVASFGMAVIIAGLILR